MLTYTDDKKRWSVEAEEEEWRRGKGYMQRLKRRWNEQYPEISNVLKQHLKDNAVRFRREMDILESNEANRNNSEENKVVVRING